MSPGQSCKFPRDTFCTPQMPKAQYTDQLSKLNIVPARHGPQQRWRCLSNTCRQDKTRNRSLRHGVTLVSLRQHCTCQQRTPCSLLVRRVLLRLSPHRRDKFPPGTLCTTSPFRPMRCTFPSHTHCKQTRLPRSKCRYRTMCTPSLQASRRTSPPRNSCTSSPRRRCMSLLHTKNSPRMCHEKKQPIRRPSCRFQPYRQSMLLRPWHRLLSYTFLLYIRCSLKERHDSPRRLLHQRGKYQLGMLCMPTTLSLPHSSQLRT